MKRVMRFVVMAIVLAAVMPVVAQTATDTWTGTWEGKLDGRPAVTLRINEREGAAQGQAEFYLLKRGHDGAPFIADKMTVAMVNTHIKGAILDFQIIREDRSVTPPDQTLVSFTLSPTGADKAILTRAGGGDGANVEMVRTSRELSIGK